MYRRLNHLAVPGYAPICMDTNDPHTVENAFKKRLMRDVPKPEPGALKDFGRFVDRWLARHMRPVRPLEFEEWLATTSYNESRKDELRCAWFELRGGLPTKSQRQAVSSFIKSEFYDLFKHARMINSRSDYFKVFSGPLFKAIEDELYKSPYFIKHVPVPERPALIEALIRAGRRYIDSDFKAFESHFTPAVMEAAELKLYRWCLRDSLSAEALDALCNTIKGTNRMRLRNGIKADVEGRRMSGDMCTSLGNGFTNIMLALYIAERKHYEITGFVEGDDGIFAISGQPDAWVPGPSDSGEPVPGPSCGLVREYERLGFTIEINSYKDPRLASFCGMVFGPDGAIVRDPRHFMRGFAWTQSFINAGPRIMDELLRAKALSACYETPNCPVVGAFARKALELTEGVVPRWVDDGYHKRPPDEWRVPEFGPTEATRQLFADRYGLSIEDQIAAETAIMRGDMVLLAELLPPTADDIWYSSRYLVTD
jgi:hypothetical protein